MEWERWITKLQTLRTEGLGALVYYLVNEWLISTG